MSVNRMTLPIGVDSFAELRQRSCYFVDKSAFLYEIMERSGKAKLILRPRHSGKSIDLDMLRQFLSINGDPSLFDGLQITQEKDFCRHHMGKYPVLYLNLKSVNAEDYESACEQLANLFSETAQSMPYLATSDKFSEYDFKYYDRILHLAEMPKNTSHEQSYSKVALKNAAYDLTGLLWRHYGEQVAVLIDEYDVPLYHAHLHGYGDRMNDLIHSMLHQLLKGNENLDFGVVMGCLRLPRAGVFSGLNNLYVMNHSYDFRRPYFAFSEGETAAVLAYYGISEKLDALREWYGRSNPEGAVVYNPQDVWAFVDRSIAGKTADPQQDWKEGSDVLETLLSRGSTYTQENYVRLLAGESVSYSIREDLAYGDSDFDGSGGLWSRLALSGTLSIVQPAKRGISSYSRHLLAANRKVRWQFADALREWLQEQCGVQADWMEQFCLAAEQGERAVLKSTLDNILVAVHAVLDKKERYSRQDTLYHGALLGLLPPMRVLQADLQVGKDSVDVSFQADGGQGVVLVLREASEGNLRESSAEAMRHLEENGYAEKLLEQGASVVQCYGIAVRGKKCMVRRKMCRQKGKSAKS